MKQQEIRTTRANKSFYKFKFIPKTLNPNEQTPKLNQIPQQVTNIAVNNQKIQNQLTIYEWRLKTKFPIIKVIDFKILQKKTNCTFLEIKKQKYSYTLKNCKQLPLFKVLYLLKESIIGFERLYNKFGPFLVASSMIVIDNTQKCRVWINQNYASNVFIPLKMDQAAFLKEIYRIYELKSNNLKNTSHFYQLIQARKTFCQALNFIQSFSKENKIIISTSCRLISRQIVEELQKKENQFKKSLSIDKKSKLLPLAGLRISLDTTSQNLLKKNRKTNTGLFQYSEKDNFSLVLKQKNKKTQDTAQEASYIKCFSNDPEKINRNKDLELQLQLNKQTIYKSELLINVNTPRKGKCFVRNCNSNSIGMKLPNQDKQAEKNLNHHQINLKEKVQKSFKIFGEIEDDEDEQITKNKIQNTFLKNQWNKKINGLLEQKEDQLKHSIVNTQGKVKDLNTPVKLQLLEKINKNIYQSFINTQQIVFHVQEPQNTYQ